ncbi:hypothetical protein ABZT27_34960 [Streptomyces sp. NPDC005389]|uniref:hypothetical protein n=1 Tax=Streptomyces sp. NPDC005389 TaxID=3157040 RepID=UPI0033AD5B30
MTYPDAFDVDLTQVALVARVGRAADVTWRRRHGGLEATGGTAQSPLFPRAAAVGARLLFDAVPWGNFPHGDRAREAVHQLHTGDSPARHATGVLGGLCANDSRAAASLAVPFLIPIATDVHHPQRFDVLGVLSAPARARHFGVASRENSFSTAPTRGATPPTTTTTTTTTASR